MTEAAAPPGLAARVAALRGWRRAAAAAVAGALATLALPPLNLVPALIPTFLALFWLVRGSTGPRGAFAAGWWIGFGYFACGLYWISFALLTDIARYGWMVPFAVAGLSAGLAVFTGLAGLALRFGPQRGVAGVLAVATAWTLAEYARGTVLTGFPWNLVGTTWTVTPATMQAAALVGAYGLSLLAALAAAAPALWWEGGRRHRALAVALPLAIAGALWGGGALRLDGATDSVVPGVTLRLVQPDIAQTAKWSDGQRDAHLARTIALSHGAGWARVTHVIWPETAIPFFIGHDAVRREAAATAAPPGGLLIAGAPRFSRDAAGEPEVWNAVHAIDPAGVIVATYDKVHLVPFGEYVPLRGLLPIEKITAGSRDFSAGPGLRTIRTDGLPPFSPLICYEGIFPGAVARDDDRPAWLLNVTNDAWFGLTAGPHQHFAAVRLRAVEEGVPLVRVANNGISAIVDPYGRVTAHLPLGAAGTVDGALPAALAAPTPFARAGNLPVLLALATMAVALWGTGAARRRSTSR